MNLEERPDNKYLTPMFQRAVRSPLEEQLAFLRQLNEDSHFQQEYSDAAFSDTLKYSWYLSKLGAYDFAANLMIESRSLNSLKLWLGGSKLPTTLPRRAYTLRAIKVALIENGCHQRPRQPVYGGSNVVPLRPWLV